MTFVICCLLWICLIVVFNSLFNLKLKATILVFFSMHQFLSIITNSQCLSSKNPSESLSLFMFFLIILINRKLLFSTFLFVVLYKFAVIFLISPKNLKSLVLFQGYNGSILDKVLNELKKPKRSLCNSTLCLFIFIFFHFFKNLWNPFTFWPQNLFLRLLTCNIQMKCQQAELFVKNTKSWRRRKLENTKWIYIFLITTVFSFFLPFFI